MSNVVVTLGGVPFRDFEVPEKISFGGAQRVAVNRLIGGGRVVNALGEDDGEIHFGGVFSGDDAAARAQLLDAARTLGTAIPLAWGRFFYMVVLAEFAAEYTKPWWIPFAVRCVVATDPVAALAGLVTPVADLIGNDIAAAASLSVQAGISLLGLSGSNPAYAAAQATIGSAIASNGLALSNGADGLAAANDAAGGVAGMGEIMIASSQLAALGGINGYVNRAASLAAQL
jgi:hypothetical protein